jgi:hypothetical protein
VSDPNSGINEIYLGDLYYRFTKLLKPEIINQLHGFFVSGVTKDKMTAFIESIKEDATKYFETVRYFIGGADGKFEPFKMNNEQGAMNNEELWEEFKGYIERLIGLSRYVKNSGHTPADKMLKEFAKRLKERQLLCAAALGYGLLAILRPVIGRGTSGVLAANLAFEHWDLDRKLREQYRVYGATDDEVWRLGEISKATLRRTAPQRISDYMASSDTASEAKLFAETIIIKNYLHDDFRCLMGINSFNDVSWFNKEAFESLLFYGTLFFVLENDSAYSAGKQLSWLDRAACIAEIAEVMDKAKTASGYQLENLIQLLAGKKTAEKKTVEKKPVEKKAVEKKAVAKKPAEKKPVAKKPVAKKPVDKKTVGKKPVAKKVVENKTSGKKTADKKTKPGKRKGKE